MADLVSTAATLSSYNIFTPVKLSRTDLPQILSEHLLLNRGAEIGVWRGEFSAHILSQWPGFMYLVDPWQGDLYNYPDIRNEPQHIVEGYYAQTILNMQPYVGRFEIIRATSVDASYLIPDNSLDFVYIDANHTYPYCLQDCQLWYPKVRSGGFFGGHDFLDGENICGSGFGVRSAVTDFRHQMGLNEAELFVLDEAWPSWYFFKP